MGFGELFCVAEHNVYRGGDGERFVWKDRLWPDCDEPRTPSVLLENIHFPRAGQSYNHFHTYFIMGLSFYKCQELACFKGYSPTRRCLRNEEGRNVNGSFQMGYLSIF